MTHTAPTLMVCLQCGSALRDEHGCKLPNPEAYVLADNLRTALSNTPIEVKLVRCFSHCKDAIAWALRAEDKFNYVFAPHAPVEDIAQLATEWLSADHHGRIPRKQMPASIQATLKSRIPPILPEDQD